MSDLRCDGFDSIACHIEMIEMKKLREGGREEGEGVIGEVEFFEQVKVLDLIRELLYPVLSQTQDLHSIAEVHSNDLVIELPQFPLLAYELIRFSFNELVSPHSSSPPPFLISDHHHHYHHHHNDNDKAGRRKREREEREGGKE